MKNLFAYGFLLLFVALTTVSCLKDDNDPYDTFGYIPATGFFFREDSIQPVNKPTDIHVTFKVAGDCQDFIEFRELPSLEPNSAKVGVFGKQRNNVSCENTERTETKTLKFVPRRAGEQTLEIWAGKDAAGTDIYISRTFTVPAE